MTNRKMSDDDIFGSTLQFVYATLEGGGFDDANCVRYPMVSDAAGKYPESRYIPPDCVNIVTVVAVKMFDSIIIYALSSDGMRRKLQLHASDCSVSKVKRSILQYKVRQILMVPFCPMRAESFPDLSGIPVDAKERILYFLPLKSLISLSTVCRGYNETINGAQGVWSQLSLQDFNLMQVPLSENPQSSMDMYKTKFEMRKQEKIRHRRFREAMERAYSLESMRIYSFYPNPPAFEDIESYPMRPLRSLLSQSRNSHSDFTDDPQIMHPTMLSIPYHPSRLRNLQNNMLDIQSPNRLRDLHNSPLASRQRRNRYWA